MGVLVGLSTGPRGFNQNWDQEHLVQTGVADLFPGDRGADILRPIIRIFAVQCESANFMMKDNVASKSATPAEQLYEASVPINVSECMREVLHASCQQRF
eukprot:9475606-Pyramimonas_sp.AAC.1